MDISGTNNATASDTHTEFNNPDSDVNDAYAVLRDYYDSLINMSWDKCYDLLTDETHSEVLREDFNDYCNSIELCFRLQSFNISFTRLYSNCRLNKIMFPLVAEFKVSVINLDTDTFNLVSEASRRCAAFDGQKWRVWLGPINVKSSSLRYRMLADSKKNVSSLNMLSEAVERTDPVTGLLSEKGFYEEALREVARTNRYNNPFSLLAFQLNCNSRGHETVCLKQLADIIKHGLRATDIAAKLDNNQIICLLTETQKVSGEAAANKFINLIRDKQTEHYDISFGVVFFGDCGSLKEAVLTACSIADSNI